MKALTLTQPWATLVAIGAKTIETRSFQRNYRGPLAIHAARGPGDLGSFKAMRDLCGAQPFFDALCVIVPDHDRYCDRDAIFERLPCGAIVAVCQLFDCLPAEEVGCIGWKRWQYPGTDQCVQWHTTEQERAFGDYSAGRYAWLLGNVRALPEPIPAKGALGLWDYTTGSCSYERTL